MSQFENLSQVQTHANTNADNLFQDAYKAVEEHPVIAGAAAVGLVAVTGIAGKSLMDLSEAAALAKNEEQYSILNNSFLDLAKQNKQNLEELVKQSPDVSELTANEWRTGVRTLQDRQDWLDTPAWKGVQSAGVQLEKLKGESIIRPNLFTSEEIKLLADRNKAMSTMLNGFTRKS